jgi:hypothetical protein
MATTAKTQEVVKLNLYQKLLKIQQEVIGLGKDTRSHSYQYVSGAKVIEHIKPLMNKHGLLLKQEVLNIENSRQDYLTSKGAAKSEILSSVSMKFTWIDTETGERDENMFGALGMNDWEKGLGSALTYAERYFLLKYFHINTDEDDIDNPERKKEMAKQPIADARFQAALKAIANGTFTKEQLTNGFELTPEQIKKLG